MKSFKKWLCVLLVVLILPVNALASLDAQIDIESRTTSYLIGDFESGRVLEEFNIDEPMNTASISKLMTYLVVKDQAAAGNISLADRVTVSKEMEEVGGSNFRLLEGEVLTVEDLLTGLMVVSGNDAAYALAVHTAGSEEAFVGLMNQKAQELGLAHGEFHNASGLQAETGQNTMTTREVFLLSKAIIEKYPEVLDYGTINILNMPERNYSGQTTLPLVGVPGVDGLKTGFTEEAGYCLVTTMDAKQTSAQEDYRIITVVMGTASLDERRDISQYLLDYTLENYSMRTVLDAEMPFEELVVNSAQNPIVPIYPVEGLERLERDGVNYTYDTQINEDIKAPINKGQVLGQVKVSLEGEEVANIDLVSKYDIEKAGIFTRLVRAVENVFSRLLSFLKR